MNLVKIFSESLLLLDRRNRTRYYKDKMALQKNKARQITDFVVSRVVVGIVENLHSEEIILFGSRTWGKPKEWSDMDTLLMMNYTEPPSQVAARISLMANPQYVAIDILLSTRIKSIRDLKLGIILLRGLARGRVLYERKAG